MRKFKLAAIAAMMCGSAFAATSANAATIMGSFSLGLSSGSYVGANNSSATATTATGLDFGMSSLQGGNGMGNGYGTNGSGVVYNTTGSFTGLNGTFASVADLALTAGGTATPFSANPFITLGAYTFSIADATFTRSPLGTSVTVTGTGTFSDGNVANNNTGTFSLATSSQDGSASNMNFTFTSNLATAVPEPATWAMMLVGFGMVGAATRYRRKGTKVAYA